jgi:hypothetical protein
VYIFVSTDGKPVWPALYQLLSLSRFAFVAVAFLHAAADFPAGCHIRYLDACALSPLTLIAGYA